MELQVFPTRAPRPCRRLQRVRHRFVAVTPRPPAQGTSLQPSCFPHTHKLSTHFFLSLEAHLRCAAPGRWFTVSRPLRGRGSPEVRRHMGGGGRLLTGVERAAGGEGSRGSALLAAAGEDLRAAGLEPRTLVFANSLAAVGAAFHTLTEAGARALGGGVGGGGWGIRLAHGCIWVRREGQNGADAHGCPNAAAVDAPKSGQ